DNFRLIDSDGKLQELAADTGKKKIVVMAWSSNCSGARDILSWAENALSSVSRNEVQLYFLDSSRPQNRALVNRLKNGLTDFPVLMDFSQTIARGFKFEHSGDFLVFSTS